MGYDLNQGKCCFLPQPGACPEAHPQLPRCFYVTRQQTAGQKLLWWAAPYFSSVVFPTRPSNRHWERTCCLKHWRSLAAGQSGCKVFSPVRKIWNVVIWDQPIRPAEGLQLYIKKKKRIKTTLNKCRQLLIADYNNKRVIFIFWLTPYNS